MDVREWKRFSPKSSAELVFFAGELEQTQQAPLAGKESPDQSRPLTRQDAIRDHSTVCPHLFSIFGCGFDCSCVRGRSSELI